MPDFDKTKLEELLENSGYRRKWVADKIGVSDNTLYSYVKGLRSPSYLSATRLAEVLGCDVEDFYKENAA